MSTVRKDAVQDDLSQRERTRERLMDAAESLIAEKGVDGVSVRSINKAAGTSVGVMHYHFRDKESLVEAIVLRRMESLQEGRLARYRELLQQERPELRDVIEALVEPFVVLATSDDPALRRYVAFVHQLFATRSPVLERLVLVHFRKANLLLFLALKRALPDLPEDVLSARAHQAWLTLTASLAEIAGHGATPREWLQAVLQPEEQIQVLIDFIVGGLSAPNGVAGSRQETHKPQLK